MPTDPSHIRTDWQRVPLMPAQSWTSRLGTRLIQFGNAINDFNLERSLAAAARLLASGRRQCGKALAVLYLACLNRWRRFRSHKFTDIDALRGLEAYCQNAVRVDRKDVISLEDARLEVYAAIEHERERIGRDMHDALGQMLTAAGIMSSTLQQSLRGENHPDAPKAEALAAMIRQTAHEAQKQVHGVAESPVAQKSLDRALNDYCADVRRWFNVACEFEGGELSANALRTLPISVGTELFRIIQEAVTGAVRHEQATQVLIRLDEVSGEPGGDARLLVNIENNGRIGTGRSGGFNSGQGDGFGMGRQIMQCRAGNIGAELEIRPRPAGGTIVECTLPLAEHSSSLELSTRAAGREIAQQLRVATVAR